MSNECHIIEQTKGWIKKMDPCPVLGLEIKTGTESSITKIPDLTGSSTLLVSGSDSRENRDSDPLKNWRYTNQ